MRLGRRGGVAALPQQDQPGFDAQKFGDPPTLLVTFAFGERLVDRREGLSDVARSGQSVRQRSEHERVIRNEAGRAELIERSAEHLESLGAFAALDESGSVE